MAIIARYKMIIRKYLHIYDKARYKTTEWKLSNGFKRYIQSYMLCWQISFSFMMEISKTNTKVYMSFLIHVRKTKVHRLLISLGMDIVSSISVCSITMHSVSISRDGCGLISTQSKHEIWVRLPLLYTFHLNLSRVHQ